MSTTDPQLSLGTAVGIEDQGSAQATGTPGTSPGTPPQIDPDQLAALQEQVGQYQRAFAALEPAAGLIKAVLDNPEERQFVEQSLEYYRNGNRAKPAIPPEYQALQKHFDDQIAPIRQVAEQVQKAQQSDLQQRQTRAQQELVAYFQPIVDRQPDLKSNQALGILAMQARELATSENLSFKDAFARIGGEALLPKSEARKTPPASLRGDAGMPGIPQTAQPPAYKPVEGQQFSLRDAFLATHNRLNGKAS